MEKPWVSFCISTYKRPDFLKKQLALLLQQTFPFFEVVISDNDTDASARGIIESFQDSRLKYFHNGENLGMIKSFNLSIDRSTTSHIVMVTDDDPVETNFLEQMFELYNQFPHKSIYCGFLRAKKMELETIEKSNFLDEILDTGKTTQILWSSCVMKRDDALAIGKIPDYGSPHLADHAFIAMVGSVNGGIVINKMFSSLTSHDANYSKFNFDAYVLGCKGFYETLFDFCRGNINFKRQIQAIVKHLGVWFIGSFFILKRYYLKTGDMDKLSEIENSAQKILSLKFMEGYIKIYVLKKFFLFVKKKLNFI